MSFPLRRLPLLASINIIKNIDVEDIINVIHMSTRMRKLVKISNVPIQLYVIGEVEIYFKKQSDSIGFNTVDLFVDPEKSSKNLPFQPSVSLYTNDKDVEGYRRMMDDFVEFFVVRSIELNLATIVSAGISMKYLEYAMSLGLKLNKVQLAIDDQNSVDDNRKFLLTCAHVPQLEVVSLTRNPIFDVLHEYSMDKFDLTIRDNHEEFTIDHLFALINCSSVTIKYVTLSDEDLNTFLKFWMTGAGRMSSLDIELAHTEFDIEPFDAEVVMNGIVRRELQGDFQFEIEKSNGVKAKAMCRNFRFSLRNIE